MKARREKTGPYTVCLLGASLDGGNLGVCALASGLIRLIRQARPAARIVMLYGERRGGTRTVALNAEEEVRVRVLNYRLSPRARLGEHLGWLLLLALAWRCVPPLRAGLLRRNLWLHTLAGADYVGEIHAGDSFSDIYGVRRFLTGIVPDLIALLLGKRLVFMPQTYGPFGTRLARALARLILRGAARLHARDKESLGTARLLLGDAAGDGERRVRYCPDVAFALEPAGGGAMAVEPPLTGKGPLLVGLNVSGLLAMGGYTRANMFALACDYPGLIERLIGSLMERTAAELLLVPHVIDDSAESDVGASRKIWRRSCGLYPGRVHLLTGRYGPGQVKALIGRCDFFIGSRMHACIAALSQGIPALGIAYSAKFQGVFETAGVGELAIDARRLSAEEIVERCLAALGRREQLHERLAARMPALRARLARCFEEELRIADCGLRIAECGIKDKGQRTKDKLGNAECSAGVSPASSGEEKDKGQRTKDKLWNAECSAGVSPASSSEDCGFKEKTDDKNLEIETNNPQSAIRNPQLNSPRSALHTPRLKGGDTDGR